MVSSFALDDRLALVERVAEARGVDIAEDLAVVRAARDRAARRLDVIEKRLIEGPLPDVSDSRGAAADR